MRHTGQELDRVTSASPQQIILASGSQTRADILTGAGVSFTQQNSGLDEDPVKKDAITRGETPQNMAQTLAFLKAELVSGQMQSALVIGADQVLVCEGKCFDKPETMAEARAHLEALRGKTHTLETAIAVVCDGRLIWHYESAPQLTMRDFSDEFLEDYLARVGPKVLWSVGAYQLEGPGIQLFEAIEGDYFSILGLQVLPLLEFLRAQGCVDQ